MYPCYMYDIIVAVLSEKKYEPYFRKGSGISDFRKDINCFCPPDCSGFEASCSYVPSAIIVLGYL